MEDGGLRRQDDEHGESAFGGASHCSIQDVLPEGSCSYSCGYTSVLRVTVRCRPIDLQETVTSSWRRAVS